MCLCYIDEVVADGCTFSCPPSPTLPQCLAGTGAWQRINTAVKLHSPRYPVFDLQDGQKYQFRVYSVNMYGSSEASVPSEPIQKVDEDGKGWDQCTDFQTQCHMYSTTHTNIASSFFLFYYYLLPISHIFNKYSVYLNVTLPNVL